MHKPRALLLLIVVLYYRAPSVSYAAEDAPPHHPTWSATSGQDETRQDKTRSVHKLLHTSSFANTGHWHTVDRLDCPGRGKVELPLRRFDFLARLPSMRNRPYGSRSCLATKRVRNQDKKRLFLSCKSFIMLHNAARINGYSDETEQKEKEQETSEAFSSSCILRLMF
ncbi:hypothetical protein F4821DRAFT_104377 [Hypoxylon rubiginosum]|uniref:Uncharacterized protein n=1 Tax=Hypoxylon rubiginosum TaxID=110542 RepID=A0ACC0D405_9PEZI|nr:hypothetical protein F4821DRAFT_104377 [Hypoxylon rubiginosum]